MIPYQDDTVKGQPASSAGKAIREQVLLALAAWEGSLSRGRVRAVLGLSTASASRVIADFVGQRPGQFEFSNQARAFVQRPGFKSTVASPSFNDYLRIVGAPADVTVVSQPIDQTSVSPSVYQAMLHGIRDGCGVDGTYASLHLPAGEVHQMFPSAFVQVNGRWHVRAWSAQRASYRDFVLSRFLEIKLRDDTKPDGLPIDEGWQTIVELRIAAHPALSEAQQRLIRLEYFGGASAQVYRIRGALVHYVINELRAALAPELERPPLYLLAVANRKAIQEWLFDEDSA